MKGLRLGLSLTGGGAVFSPATLFAGGVSGAWYDPSDLSTLWKDTAGTIPVTADGDAVARIDDKSGNGNHLTQATAGARPLYKTSGGLSWLLFDGSDDALGGTLPVASLGANISKTIFCSVAITDLSGQDVLVAYGGKTSNDTFGFTPNTVPGNALTLFQYGGDLTGGASQLGEAVYTGIKNGNALSIRKGGAVVAGPTTVAAANITNNAFLLGGLDAGSFLFGGKLYGMLIVAGTPAPASTETWLGAKAGLTL